MSKSTVSEMATFKTLTPVTEYTFPTEETARPWASYAGGKRNDDDSR